MTDRFKYLLEQYLSGNISLSEQNEFYELLATQEYDGILDLSIQNHLVNGVEGSISDLPPHIAEEIVRNIYNAEKSTAKILPLKTRRKTTWRWAAAIAASVILAISTIFLFTRNHNGKEGMLALVPADARIEENMTSNPRLVTLSDGSNITLSPQSTIHFQNNFNDSTREVYLEGEAFFQVAKNPRKPFLVYYNNLVTKVLGTSFRVKTNPKTGNLEVAVLTGKVQVYENEKITKDHSNSVILVPNQKAIYQVEKGLLETSLVEAPQPLRNGHGNEQTPKKITYDQEKLENIFRDLETAYGIEIIVETANLNNCVFTGDVSNQDLFTTLRIICLTTNSTYEINGTRILVKGTGCN